MLCSLDDTQVKIKLQLSQEKLAQAKLQMDKALIRQQKALAQIGHTQAEFERYEKARKEGLVSDKEVATYRYKLEELTHDERAAVSENQGISTQGWRTRSRDRPEQARSVTHGSPSPILRFCNDPHRQRWPTAQADGQSFQPRGIFSVVCGCTSF